MANKIGFGITILAIIALSVFYLVTRTNTVATISPISAELAKQLFVESDKAVKSLKLPALISNGMVLQRETPILLWGTAVPNSLIEVTIQNRTVKTLSNNDGLWAVNLPKLKTSASETLSINAANETRIFTNIAIGDVWLCSGQSNMAWPISKTTDDAIDELQSIEIANLRFFSVKKIYDLNTYSSFASEERPIGNWFTAESKKEFENFSAVCGLSAKEIYEKTQIPQGFILSAHATTYIEAWLNLTQLDEFPEYRPIISTMYTDANIENSYSYIKACDKRLIPASHYNTMIFPIINFTYKGIIWYQGENNIKHTENYAGLLTSLLGHWKINPAKGANVRDIYVIELVSFDEPGDKHSWAAIRQSQSIAVSNQTRTFLIPASDLGDPENVHPVDKMPLVSRLNTRILANSYGLATDIVAPKVHTITIRENSIELIVNITNDTLEEDKTSEISGFELASTDGQYFSARAVLSKGNIISVTSDKVPSPRYIRYRWSNVPQNGIFITKSSRLPILGFSNNPADFSNKSSLNSLTSCN